MGQQGWAKESGDRNLMNQIAAQAMTKRDEIYCFGKEKKSANVGRNDLIRAEPRNKSIFESREEPKRRKSVGPERHRFKQKEGEEALYDVQR